MAAAAAAFSARRNPKNRVVVIQASLTLQPVDAAQSAGIRVGEGEEDAPHPLMNQSHRTPSRQKKKNTKNRFYTSQYFPGFFIFYQINVFFNKLVFKMLLISYKLIKPTSVLGRVRQPLRFLAGISQLSGE